MDPRVEDYALLNGWGLRALDRWSREAERHAVAALRDIGLIDPDDALPVSPTPQEKVDDGIRARAVEWARRQIAAAPAPREAASWMPRLGGAFEGLRAVGALDRATARELSRALDAVPISWPEYAEPFVALDASDGPVAVLPGPAVRRLGWRVMAVELHAAVVVVHYEVARLGRSSDGTWPLLPDEVDGPAAGDAWIDGDLAPLRLTDDAGTSYVSGGSDDGGAMLAEDGTHESAGFAAFTPQPPPEANVLQVHVGDRPIEVVLPR